MPEQLDFVVEFDDLRVLFLAELVAILLIHVELLPVLIVIFIVIVVLIFITIAITTISRTAC